MFPGIYGFRWEPGHLIFLGLFFSVLMVIIGTSALSMFRSRRTMKKPNSEALLWSLDFRDLPRDEKKCRHELSGILEERVCPNAFDCRECDTHASLVDLDFPVRSSSARPVAPVGAGVLEPDPGRLYHRGHTWVAPSSDGSVSIGLDPIAARLVGSPDRLWLPEAGTSIYTNGTAWRITKRNVDIRVLAPIDGEVIESANGEQGWYLRVRPATPLTESVHLLKGAEAKTWFLREADRLQALFALPAFGPVLNDGGVLADNLADECSRADWERISSSFFLQP